MRKNILDLRSKSSSPIQPFQDKKRNSILIFFLALFLNCFEPSEEGSD